MSEIRNFLNVFGESHDYIMELFKLNKMYYREEWNGFFEKYSKEPKKGLEETPLFILLSLCFEFIILNDEEMYELTYELTVLLIQKLQRKVSEEEVNDFIMACAIKLKFDQRKESDGFLDYVKKSKLEDLLIKREKRDHSGNIDDEILKKWEEMKQFFPLESMISYFGEVIIKHEFSM